MPDSPFKPGALKDGLGTFERGINHGIAAELVPDNQLYDGINTNLRGYLCRPRSYFYKRNLNYLDPAVRAVLNTAWVQGGCVYQPDGGGKGCIMLSAGGKLYRLEIDGNQANVTDVTGANAQSANATQCWLWQAEKWVIWNDGSTLPVFYDGSATARSNFGSQTTYQTFNTVAFTIPAVGSTVNVTLNDATNVVVGDIFQIQYQGQFQVLDISAAPVIKFLNINATPAGFSVPVPGGNNMYWRHTTGFQLPAGRQGAYGKGRIWMALTDGKQYLAGDQVGGSSGTQAENFRDAILNVTENLYLAGGGYFAVPGTVGEITAMKFATVLDASLGQGPLQIFTRNTVFSCNAPTNRLEWQDVTNPIQTESLIGTGATGQDSTVTVNGDIVFRSTVGLTSLILARREFDTWGNTPQSHEVNPTFSLDDQSLLPWGSGINFDNRLLMTTQGVTGPHGVYWTCLVPINFDPLSGLAGKAPSIYDARVWEGLNIYKVFTGEFSGQNRAFAVCWNKNSDELELYEILTDKPGEVADNGGLDRVTWIMESGAKDFHEPSREDLSYKRLINGEIAVEDLVGRVDFQVYWKPDDWPCWVPWHQWTECSSPPTASNKPGYRPRMGLGEPRPDVFDNLGRPLREGYHFRVRIVITGHCTFKGMKMYGLKIAEPQYAPLALDYDLCQ
jgi:hypothetical protein